MKIRKSGLEKIAVMEEQYPKFKLPEVAFAGRSNVGKSTFINSIANNKNLARTSGKPGKTRTINFYNINEEFRLVDLPGYGYARVSKEEKEKWGHIIEEYLTERDNLKEVVLIVDIRHRPTKDDIMMYNWIKHFGYGSFVVATKADKLSKNQINKSLEEIKEALGMDDANKIIPYSSKNRLNVDRVWTRIEAII